MYDYSVEKFGNCFKNLACFIYNSEPLLLYILMHMRNCAGREMECNYICPSNGSLQRKSSIRWSKFCWGTPQDSPPLNVCFARYLESCHLPPPPPPPLLLHQYTGSASGPYQSKTATSGPCITHNVMYRYMQTHAHMHTLYM